MTTPPKHLRDFRLIDLMESDKNSSSKKEEILALIDKGVNLEEMTVGGSTALMIAASQGDLSLVHLLVEKGSDVNTQREFGGMTALMCAKDEGIICLLLAKGADINAKELCGNTALMRAAIDGEENIVRILLDHGANPDIASGYGRTPLITAAVQGFAGIVKMLVEKAVALQMFDPDGETALSLAMKKNNKEIVEILRAALMLRAEEIKSPLPPKPTNKRGNGFPEINSDTEYASKVAGGFYTAISGGFYTATSLKQDLIVAFEKVATPEKKAKLKKVQEELERDINLSHYADSFSDLKGDKERVAAGRAKQAEIITSVLIGANPFVEKDLVDLFKTAAQNTQNPAGCSISFAVLEYEELGAPTLARLAHKAGQPKFGA